jgi:hypothetical protein
MGTPMKLREKNNKKKMKKNRQQQQQQQQKRLQQQLQQQRVSERKRNKELFRMRAELHEANERIKILKNGSSDKNELMRLEGIIGQYEIEKLAFIDRITKLKDSCK